MTPAPHSRDNIIAPQRIAYAILLYFVLIAAIYAATTPTFETPDEAGHFLYIHNMLQSGELPTLFESRDAIFASGSTQRHHPPLYYLAGALLILPTERADLDDYLISNPFSAIGTAKPNNANAYLHHSRPPTDDTHIAIMLLRGLSIALGAGTVWMIYRIGAIAFQRETIGLVAMLLVASMPMYVFITASVNSDNMVTFFYTAGLLWIVRIWRNNTISNADIALLSAILAGIALSKVNGLSLFGLVYAGLLFTALRGRLAWRRGIVTIIVSGGVAVMLAGWWYLRNIQLYGDPMAIEIMRGIWGRGNVPTELAGILSEASGVWLSFWMVLGKFNIRAPDWVYIYATLITFVGIIGLVLRRQDRLYSLLFIGAFTLVLASLIVTTREINVSQGRILYPALGAFAALMAAGWYTLLRRFTPLAVLPLTMMTIITPFTVLPRAYTTLDTVQAIPQAISNEARAIAASAGSINTLAYGANLDPIKPGDTLRVTVYFSVEDITEDAALSVRAIDPLTQAVYGGTEIYPGMTFTSELKSGQIYRTEIAFVLDAIPEAIPPRQLRLALGWLVLDDFDKEQQRGLIWQDATGNMLTNTLLVNGPTLIDRRYTPPPPETAVLIAYGGQIALAGYTLETENLTPGDALTIDLHWRYLDAMADDWTVTVGLLDSNGKLITQNDGMPPGYPTSAWRPGPDFIDRRVLNIPPDAEPGDYRLYIGWYDAANGQRLSTGGPNIENDLYFLPETLQIEAN